MVIVLVVFLGLLATVAAGALFLTQPLAGATRVGPAVSPSAERLEESVRTLVGRFGPRDVEHPANLRLASSWIAGALQQAGARVEVQGFERAGQKFSNVVAKFGPADGPRVVVGAHYDTFEPLPGADDNASGVAGLLELAVLLGKEAPAGPVELVAYSLEEPPAYRTDKMGSAVHAQSLVASGVKVRAMIALEMIGCFDDTEGSQQMPSALLAPLYPSRGDFVAVVGDLGGAGLVRAIKRAMAGASELPVRSINAPRAVPGIAFSDHRNYWERGYPAVMVTDTAFNRNPRYHTAQDTPETLDYRRMALVVQGVHSAVWALSAPR